MEHWEIQELINTLEEASEKIGNTKISAKIESLNDMLADHMLSM